MKQTNLKELRESALAIACLADELGKQMRDFAALLGPETSATPEAKTPAAEAALPLVHPRCNEEKPPIAAKKGSRKGPRLPSAMPIGEPPPNKELKVWLNKVAELGNDWKRDGKPFLAVAYKELRETAAWAIVRNALCEKYTITKGSMAAFVATMVGSHAAHRVAIAKSHGREAPLIC